MKRDLWEQCRGSTHLATLSVSAWRMVEGQHLASTRKLVDSLEEQKILEELIESSKPPFQEASLNLHYLLSTPFRYPPLQRGSRFGTRFEPSLWYGSLELSTALAETAYYRFNFLRASKTEFGNVITNHTAFTANIKTERGIDLSQAPFSKYSAIISSPALYQGSQLLGKMMRKDKVEAFFYLSARDPHKANNLALFTPQAFSKKNPNSQSFQSWQCIVNQDRADFIRLSSGMEESRSFPLDHFLFEGELPFPAN